MVYPEKPIKSRGIESKKRIMESNFENKFGRITEFIDTLEQTELTDEQQVMLLVGTAGSGSSGSNNCQCSGNNCQC